MKSYAVGNFIRIRPGTTVLYRFQNFYINQTKRYDGETPSATYNFVPFGFSGVTINRTGDGLDASLVFPNNDLSKAWVSEAVESRWIIEVDVLAFDPDVTQPSVTDRVHTYTGQVTGGRHDQTSVQVALGTVLDAVGADVPMRTLTNKLVGNLPVTANVSLR